MLDRCYDLHCHSNQSDGILSPEALVSRANDKEVSVLALTDHDTVAGIERARAQAELLGVELINGVEFSCQWAGRNIHIVALGFDIAYPQLVQMLSEQESLRETRSEMIAQRLEKIGFKDALKLARDEAEGAAIGRPHFAKAMIKAGMVNSMDQAFKRYLGAGKPGDIKQIWPEIGDVVEIVNGSGGVAVIAHPLKYKITRTKLRSLVSEFKECGGGAIEVASGIQKPQDTREMGKLAEKYELLASCGSDFHSPTMHWGELGKVSALPEGAVPVWSHWESTSAVNV